MNDESSPGAEVPAPEPHPLHVTIAEQVRANSQSARQPTRLEITDTEGVVLDSAATVALIEEMEAQPEYADIRHLVVPDGAVYAYSNRYITDAYARLFGRIVAGDHLATIAATVREDSERYPRPTPVKCFLQPPYDLSEEELEGALRLLAESPDHKDIRAVSASNGAVYLYSDRYLDQQYARSRVEWEEVESHLNP